MSNNIPMRRDVLCLMILAFVVVTLFSTSSFLYPFNQWDDANCIFTVGKSIFCGKVPYRDLMDHKGFLLHLINGIGSLISFKSFFGVYIMELISGFIFLWACYKTLLLFANRRILYLMPFLAFAVYSSPCFEKGASAEEFCLSLLSYSFFIGLRSVLNRKMLTVRDLFLLGVLASCVFWIKYTLCGLYAGLGIGLCLFYIQNNWQKQILRSIGCFFVGFIPVSAAVILYFAYNHALSDLWMVYFYDNLFNYGVKSGRFWVLGNIFKHELFALEVIGWNRWMTCMLIGSLIEIYLQKNKDLLVFCLTCLLCMFVMLFVGFPYQYYPLPLAIWMPLSLLLALRVCKRTTQRRKCILYLVTLIFVMTYCGCQIRVKLFFASEKNCAALKISKFIMDGKEQSPSMIEYGIMDLGVYTLCGYVPECKNFCLLNLPIKEQTDAQNNYITTCHPTYVISERPLAFDGYKCISIQTQNFAYIDYFPFFKLVTGKGAEYYLYRYNNAKAL